MSNPKDTIRQDWPAGNWKEALGKERGELLYKLWIEEQRLIAVFTQLRGLLTLSTADQMVIRRTVNAFAEAAIESMWVYVFVSLHRFSDNRKGVVSLNTWRKRYSLAQGSKGHKELQACMERLAHETKRVTTIRHRYIAHLVGDSQFNDGPSTSTLDIHDVERAMQALNQTMRALFDSVNLGYPATDTGFLKGGYMSLVQIAKAGLKSEIAHSVASVHVPPNR